MVYNLIFVGVYIRHKVNKLFHPTINNKMINFKLWEQLFQEIDEPLIFIK